MDVDFNDKAATLSALEKHSKIFDGMIMTYLVWDSARPGVFLGVPREKDFAYIFALAVRNGLVAAKIRPEEKYAYAVSTPRLMCNFLRMLREGVDHEFALGLLLGYACPGHEDFWNEKIVRYGGQITITYKGNHGYISEMCNPKFISLEDLEANLAMRASVIQQSLDRLGPGFTVTHHVDLEKRK